MGADLDRLLFGRKRGAAWANNRQLVDSVNFNPPLACCVRRLWRRPNWLHWQGFLLFGIEADFEGGDIGAKGRATDGNVYNFESGLNYIGTVRGRVGYTLDRALVYFTGGFAYGCLRKWSDDFGYRRYDA